MKIEIGESLMLSYLKHIKKCVFYQANWKVSSNWDIDENTNDKVSFIYNNIIKHPEFSEIFKQSKFEQLIKQSEIDVIGWDGKDKIYTADIAFHEAGLNYGSKIETKNRVFKKLLRSYLTLLAYFPDKKYELIFASPKVNNATENIIKDYFKVLNNDFSKENVAFKYISNDAFRDDVFIPIINKTKIDSDTNELFMRAIKLSSLFEKSSPKPQPFSPASFPTQEFSPDKPLLQNKLLLEFIPSDEREFKKELLITKRAKRTWYYLNNKIIIDEWDASKFTIESDLKGNILSNNKVRAWRDIGLIKVKLEILEKL